MAGTGGTIYKKTELVGTSTVGYDDAVKAAIGRACCAHRAPVAQ